MSVFRYRVRSPEGELREGVLEARDETEAVEQLRRTCAAVESLKRAPERRWGSLDLGEPLTVSARTLALTAGQLAVLLRAGLGVNRAAELLSRQSSDPWMARILKACAADTAAGEPLSRSMARHGGKIPPVFLETLRAGEESGTLEDALERLRVYYEKAHRSREKVRSALTYPILVLVLAAVVVGIVMTTLVPVMSGLFDGLGVALPLPTRILIGSSRALRKGWPLLLAAAGLGGGGLFVWGRSAVGGRVLSRVRLSLPVLGKVARSHMASQLALTLSALLGAGLPAARAVEIAARVLELPCVGEKLARGAAGLESGRALGETLAEVPELPSMLVEMAKVGEESGALESTLASIGGFYEEEATRAADRALALLEPMITVVLGLFVGFLVAAIYLPIFRMSEALSAGL